MGSIAQLSMIVVFLFTVSQLFYSTEGRYTLPCKPCRALECLEEPKEFCLYGEYQDSCGNRLCAKGPGERCGGPSGILGDCGAGMMCLEDDRCHGCHASTLQCHP